MNGAFGLDDFDRYVEENDVSEEEWPAAFARWVIEQGNGHVPTSRRIEEPNDGHHGTPRDRPVRPGSAA